MTTTGTEFIVNTYLTGQQSDSSIASFSDGGFVVTWMSQGQDGDNSGVFAQRYNVDGTANGSEFQVNTYTTGVQGKPSIAVLSDDGFVVTWESNGQDGSSYGVFAQRYNTNGTANGSEFQVNTYTTNVQATSSIAALANGEFIVTWESNGQDGADYGIFAQRYNANGTTNGSEFQVNTATASGQRNSSVTELNNGDFVITWRSQESGTGANIKGQLYNANGTASGSEFTLNTYLTNQQDWPAIAALDDGGFVVTWDSDGQDGSSLGVFGQMFNANGTKNGSEFQVNTFTSSYQTQSDISSLSDGGFVVVWSSYGQDDGNGPNNGIYGQRYNSDGTTNGSEFLVNTTTQYSQDEPSVSSLEDGGFVVTWTGVGDDNTNNVGVFAQRFDASGNKVDVGGGQHIIGTNGADTLVGTGFKDTIDGLSGADSIVGGSGNDIINGGDDNDSITGGAGNDSIVGGNGTDTATYGSAFSLATYGFTFSGQNVTVSGADGTDTVSGVEQLRFASGIGLDWNGTRWVGTDGSIILNSTGENYTGTSGVDTILGQGGADSVLGGNGNDSIDGGGGNDTLDGGADNDAVYGGDGADSILGGSGGNDTLYGGAGNDTLDAGTNADTVYGGDGNDELHGGTGNNVLYGEGGNDLIVGDLHNETMDGGDGNDTISGGGNNDSLIGGDGDDLFLIFGTGDGRDTMAGGNGNDTILGTSGADLFSFRTFSGANTVETIDGGTGTDTLEGDTTANTLDFSGTVLINISTINALDGNDSVIGSAGADTIDGGAGRDTLAGGSGADIFVFSSTADSTSANKDRITDFVDGTDIISLAGLGYTDVQAGAATGTILGYTTAGGFTTFVDSAASFSFQLTGTYTLTGADFIF